MRNLYRVFACLAFIWLSSPSALAHEPRGRVNPDTSAGLGILPPVSCGEDECASLQMQELSPRKPRALYAPPPEIFSAIESASEATGVDIVYLIKAAMLESTYDPAREVSTSSAKGLYQFVEQTWLYMMREYGAEAGLWEFAEAVIWSEKEGFTVADELLREFILSLRYDPELSALFAAAFTQRNADILERVLEREADPAELYLAHVLGASGAAELIRLADEDPGANACKAFARAAKANRTIFYEGRKPRTAEAVRNVLLNKYFDIPADTGTAAYWQPVPAGEGRAMPVLYLGDHTMIHG